jgi:pyocin large subunit-like protein
MSVQAMSWALKQQIAKDASSRHVLLVLANYAGADGEDAFPSVDRLCKDTGLSERTVRDRLGKLSKMGLIEAGNQAIAVAKGFRPDRTPTVYKMRLDRWKKEHETIEKTGVQEAHPEKNKVNGVQEMRQRGAGNASTGCSSRTLTVKEPSSNRHTPLAPQGENGGASHAPSAVGEDTFETFWNAYPAYRRAAKAETMTAFVRAMKRTRSFSAIMQGLERHLKHWPKSRSHERARVVPKSTTWLDQSQYEIEDEAIATNFTSRPSSASSGRNALMLSMVEQMTKG